MKFVQLHVLPLATVWLLLKAASHNVRKAAPVMRDTSSAGTSVFPFHSVAAHTTTATTVWAKCFILAVSVRRNATAHRVEYVITLSLLFNLTGVI